ncbi:MAG: amidase [Alphaproteobacteria bacterium]|nr:amidase [Alphaproteobacteria bacterium]MCB9931273.1 amidase [Alphaproteobacteria bacterium]
MTKASDPTLWSLTQAADAIAAGEISSHELTRACLDRIALWQSVTNAFIHLEADLALDMADATDAARARGETLGPLAGVPLAHKDMFYRAGMLATCGSKIRKDFRPDITATVMQRLDSAGAVYLGGLNMSEFALGPTGHNEHWGHCRNPWNPDHITGGSSSGSGSATGARMAFGALGSDTGGSVRLPAGANGVVGIKPTSGRVSRYGAMGLSFTHDTIGPLTRTVRDNARMFAVVAGADPNDATCSTRPLPDYEAACRNPEVKGLRIGVPDTYYRASLDPSVAEAMERSLAVFADLGAVIVPVDIPSPEPNTDLANLITGSESATLHAHWLRTRPQDYSPQPRARLESGFAVSATDYLTALQVRPRIVREFCEAAFADCDVLHVPTFDMEIPTIMETNMGDRQGFAAVIARISRCTRPFNYLSLPGLSVPAGFTANGLPASFQLVGRPYAEATLYRAAAAYEDATDFAAKAPELPA